MHWAPSVGPTSATFKLLGLRQLVYELYGFQTYRVMKHRTIWYFTNNTAEQGAKLCAFQHKVQLTLLSVQLTCLECEVCSMTCWNTSWSLLHTILFKYMKFSKPIQVPFEEWRRPICGRPIGGGVIVVVGLHRSSFFFIFDATGFQNSQFGVSCQLVAELCRRSSCLCGDPPMVISSDKRLVNCLQKKFCFKSN